MNRYWITAAVALAVSAGAAQADFGGPMMPPQPAPGQHGGHMYGQPDPAERDRYGLHPMIRRVVWWKQDAGGCTNCAPRGAGAPVGGMPMGGGYPMPMPGGYGMGGGYGGMGGGMGGGVPGAGMPGTPAAQMPGTLVFPNHWYARSPRDFFMSDTRR
jgi:hypothetical protein